MHTLSIVLQRPFSDGALQSNCGLWHGVFALPKYSAWKIQLCDLYWVFYLEPNNFPVLGVKSDVWNMRREEIGIDRSKKPKKNQTRNIFSNSNFNFGYTVKFTDNG
jgi:hypothetical protein